MYITLYSLVGWGNAMIVFMIATHIYHLKSAWSTPALILNVHDHTAPLKVSIAIQSGSVAASSGWAWRTWRLPTAAWLSGISPFSLLAFCPVPALQGTLDSPHAQGRVSSTAPRHAIAMSGAYGKRQTPNSYYAQRLHTCARRHAPRSAHQPIASNP